jgi:Fe-S-cluster-containing hydrogenase component 2
MIAVDKRECVGCEECLHVCPTGAIIMKDEKAEIIQHKCDQCERCIPACPVKAIKIYIRN